MGEDWPKAATGQKIDWRQAVRQRAQWLVVASAGLTLVSALGGFAWPLELFSHFVAWYALGTLPAALALWWARATRWALVATALCLVQAYQPLAWYVPAQGVASEGGVPCRILLANVLTSNRDHQALLDLIAETDPDVICIQEVNAAWTEALRPLEEVYPVHSVVDREDNFGIALYSRISPGLPEILFGGELRVPALAVPLEKGGASAQLLTVHALPPLGGMMANLRNRQLDAARAWHEAQTAPAVIVGDLNLTMYSPVYRRWMDGFAVKNTRQGHGPLGSWPVFVPFLRLPLDHCLVSPEIEVVDCRLGPDIGSDHLPLLIDLRLPL